MQTIDMFAEILGNDYVRIASTLDAGAVRGVAPYGMEALRLSLLLPDETTASEVRREFLGFVEKSDSAEVERWLKLFMRCSEELETESMEKPFNWLFKARDNSKGVKHGIFVIASFAAGAFYAAPRQIWTYFQKARILSDVLTESGYREDLEHALILTAWISEE
jgi:hypothetical protein